MRRGGSSSSVHEEEDDDRDEDHDDGQSDDEDEENEEDEDDEQLIDVSSPSPSLPQPIHPPFSSLLTKTSLADYLPSISSLLFPRTTLIPRSDSDPIVQPTIPSFEVAHEVVQEDPELEEVRPEPEEVPEVDHEGLVE